MLENFSWRWFFSNSTFSKRFLKNSNRFEHSHLNMLSAFEFNKQIKFSGPIRVKQDSSLKDSHIPCRWIPWPWSVTFNLSLHYISRVMGSAHQLIERNICVMFNENLTNGWGDLKDTKFKGKFLDLEMWPWHWVCIAESLVLHTYSLRGTFGWSLMKIVQKDQMIWREHKLKGKSHDFEVWPWVCGAKS